MILQYKYENSFDPRTYDTFQSNKLLIVINFSITVHILYFLTIVFLKKSRVKIDKKRSKS